ncbi:MAG: hypothetical protein AAGL96_11620 [Pseudomonadota bacterium]
MDKKPYVAPALFRNGSVNAATHGAACPNEVLDASFSADTPRGSLTCSSRADFFS